MLKLTGIVKNYHIGDITVEALKGIDIRFRKNEFVSVLGPSGCGKTTLLNIIGGLDRYTRGDLSINGVSTKKYKDTDWDAYRNKRVGFVFQTYNLIPHQTVLANVELAMTLSGVSKAERRERATAVLEKVGLGDQLDKKPNQLSGGQMQRVAIARALVNNPEILLADEPTGSLDSENSVQIAEILKEIACDRLVILVTHNGDLAKQYSTRIVRLLDGRIVDDSNPPDESETSQGAAQAKERERVKKPSMSLGTALSLSMNNLMTKKARTFLTSFAGSIGIVGIALILSLSSGMQDHIAGVQRDTMSNYPIAIEATTMDMSAIVGAAIGARRRGEPHDLDKVYSRDVVANMMDSMRKQMSTNDLRAFKRFIESEESGIGPLVNDVKYGYGTSMSVYREGVGDAPLKVHPSSLFGSPGGHSRQGAEMWQEMLENQELLDLQYDVLAGKMPEEFDELVLFVSRRNEITDLAMYSLGLKDPAELEELMRDASSGKEIDIEQVSIAYEDILGLTFKLVPGTSKYKKIGDIWVDKGKDAGHMASVIRDAQELKIVGILRPKEGVSLSDTPGGGMAVVGYTPGLSQHLVEVVNNSPVVKEQRENPDIDVFTGLPFASEKGASALDPSTLTPEERSYLASLTEEEREAVAASFIKVSRSTYDENMRLLGETDPDNPNTISIYPRDFEAKSQIKDIIDDYNQRMTDEGHPESVIQYTDFIDLMLSSVTTVINAISYVLIAFVAISLVVSSIMIGIITYISVLERTKEIGILRSIGASKKDISRVFNAETLIVGFVAGSLGITSALILCVPANNIIHRATGIGGVAALPPLGGLLLVGVSMVLTFIAGLIPARIAAKKDPVVALRTE